jgi:DNA-binding protein HU-beta
MNKADLVSSIAEKTEMTQRSVEKILDAFMESVKTALGRGDKVTLVGFGTFEVSQRQARKGRNPQTGAELHIAARKVPKFRPGKDLKTVVRTGR